jgi:hypothetical protein
MSSIEIRRYQDYSPQTIGENVLALATEAQRDGTFKQREIVGVGIRNRTLNEAITTAMKAVQIEELEPFVICDDEKIVGVATVLSGLELFRIRCPIVPAKLARKYVPVLSEKIQNNGANVFAWTPAQYAENGVLSEAYEQLATEGLKVADSIWTIEPRMTSTYVTDAIKKSGLNLVDYGYYDDGEKSGIIPQKYGFYTSES